MYLSIGKRRQVLANYKSQDWVGLVLGFYLDSTVVQYQMHFSSNKMSDQKENRVGGRYHLTL